MYLDQICACKIHWNHDDCASISSPCDTGSHYDCPDCGCACHPGRGCACHPLSAVTKP